MLTESNPLRVLLVAARYFPYTGGMETHVYEVGRRLARVGVKVTILTTDLSGQLPTFEDMDGVQVRRVHAWPANKDYYFAPDIYHIIVHGRWNLVHCQGYHNLVAPLAMLAASHAKIPYMVTFHSGGDLSYLRNALRRFHWMALRPLLAGAEYLISVSKWEAEFFSEHLHLPNTRFVIIPNGAHHLPQVPESAKQAKTNRLIVSVGRLEHYKGHQRVIAALPKVREQMPDVRLRIVGTGPYESTLWKMARRLGVSEYVDIQAVPPGDGNGMASVIGQADLVTLLSEHEAQGIAVMEALALRRPILVTGICALQEFVDRGLARSVPLQSTPEDVALAIVNQLCQPLVPVNVELPTWDQCATDLLTLYQTVIWRSQCAS